ncbi:MAG: dTDP-glucose 4,6-dehydratase [Clostridia bacterium]|nr:dTDP-glucose 4,6-dehydratase [Clostridia bacterium]
MRERHTPRSLLVTGGAGFIGTNFIRYVLDNVPDVGIHNFDALTYAGSLAGLEDVAARHGARYRFIHGDIRDRQALASAFAASGADTVVNFAAESHVDRSIDSPLAFVETNVLGTANLLQAARTAWGDRRDVRFHHISTDEVFGSLGVDGFFTEESPYAPSSPYSATKAAADHLVRAWRRTYGLPVTVSHCSNNYGPWQFPEKLIPLLLSNALLEKPLPVYGDGRNIRDWLHVTDHCRAIWTILTRGEGGESYVVGGNMELPNIELVRTLCAILDELRPAASGRHDRLITFVPDRPGHDFRYASDCAKIGRDLGWKPEIAFEQGLRDTIIWYLDNQEWVERIRRGGYDGNRLGTRGRPSAKIACLD